MPNRSRTAIARASVFSLDAARERRDINIDLQRVICRLDVNREALEKLFHSGLVFTRQGSQMGRDLLRLQQELLRAKSSLSRAVCGGTRRTTGRCELGDLLMRSEYVARRFASWLEPV